MTSRVSACWGAMAGCAMVPLSHHAPTHVLLIADYTHIMMDHVGTTPSNDCVGTWDLDNFTMAPFNPFGFSPLAQDLPESAHSALTSQFNQVSLSESMCNSLDGQVSSQLTYTPLPITYSTCMMMEGRNHLGWAYSLNMLLTSTQGITQL